MFSYRWSKILLYQNSGHSY